MRNVAPVNLIIAADILCAGSGDLRQTVVKLYDIGLSAAAVLCTLCSIQLRFASSDVIFSLVVGEVGLGFQVKAVDSRSNHSRVTRPAHIVRASERRRITDGVMATDGDACVVFRVKCSTQWEHLYFFDR